MAGARLQPQHGPPGGGRHLLGLAFRADEADQRWVRRHQEQRARGGEAGGHRAQAHPATPRFRGEPTERQLRGAEQQRRGDDGRGAEMEPDGERPEPHVGCRGSVPLPAGRGFAGAARPLVSNGACQRAGGGLERHAGREGQHGGGHVGARDAAVEDEQRRQRHQGAEERPGRRREAAAGQRRQEQQRREAAGEHREPQPPLVEHHAMVEQQPVESGQRDAAVGQLIGGEQRRHRLRERGADRVQLVAAEHLVAQVEEPQPDAGEQRQPGERSGGGRAPLALVTPGALVTPATLACRVLLHASGGPRQMEIEPLRNSVLPIRALTSTGAPPLAMRTASASTGSTSSGRAMHSPWPP